MKPPRHIQIGAHDVSVELVRGLREKEACWGDWNLDELRIRLDADAPPTLMVHTYWHEVMHAIFELTGYPEHSENEQLVDAVGGAIANIMTRRK